MSWEMFFLFQDMCFFFFFILHLFIYLRSFVFKKKVWIQIQVLNFECGRKTTLRKKNTVQIICKVMKYSKMQLHGNVCVHQMSLIFILKIKDYFSSNKAGVKTYICLFIWYNYITEIHYIFIYLYYISFHYFIVHKVKAWLTHLHENTVSPKFVSS